MAHSKRNTSLPHFTSYERNLLRSTWGSQSTRLSRESFLPFSSCRLCLLPARAPVVACAINGDLFCRECAVNDLLAQRKEIKRLEKEHEKALRDKAENEERTAEEARERELKEFEMVTMGLEGREKKRKLDDADDEKHSEDVARNGDVGKKRRKESQGFGLDEEEMRRVATGERERVRKELEREKDESSKSQLPSFWIPSLTPSTDNGVDATKPLKLNPICPASSPANKHGYSLKSLVTVNFTEEKNDKSGEVVRVCPSCKKALNNGLKAMMTKPCGHVICKSCVDQFMRPHKDPDPHAAKDELHGRMLCYVCETDITEQAPQKHKSKEKSKDKIRPGIVEMSSEGTGFAGGGNNVAKREGTAFQC